ncbi:metallophosphoesterase family protein [Janthinobacterium agaricidamnosum]|uniref:Calcineurin-like phosphoesterase family protein n=1 Tax=Janthinobacterium agaricidamnosum NBRC 102515 = DSM 9628 TaxID=1349767 RepID=W0V1J0_9BURK|nr:metallophosphoesterase [Janthinobacterium agaricidamnosum]CDG81208.1 calcineurin-like phosphoesterase family protein [Janthinobacterium agaricidamnosum NBRC 102515 = DSM 9628]
MIRCLRSLLALPIIAIALGACAHQPRRDAASLGLQGRPYTVYAAGDIADCRRLRPELSGAAQTAELIAFGLAQDPRSAVLSLGDHTYPAGLAAEFRDCYAPTWGRFKERTYPAPGNHEYYSKDAAGYYQYFAAPDGRPQPEYYSFELGAWHIVSLNSQLKDEQQRAQLEWLKNDLQTHPRRCTLAYWHEPLYSSGGHAPKQHMQAAWQVLYDAGAELVLSGHDHDYERFAAQDAHGQADQRGMRQFVVGTGGAFLTPFLRLAPHSEVRDSRSHGVLRLDLYDDGYQWAYLPVPSSDMDALPTWPDRGAGRCH